MGIDELQNAELWQQAGLFAAGLDQMQPSGSGLTGSKALQQAGYPSDQSAGEVELEQ